MDRGSPGLRDVGEHPGRGLRARVSAAAGTARARPQERAGLGVRLARVSAGASGRWEAGGSGWAREAGWGLRSCLQSLARQMGATRGRAARSRRLWGAHNLGTRTPSPSYGRSGVQRCACPGMGSMAAPLRRAISQGRAVFSGLAVRGPLRLWAEPLHVDGNRLSSPAACLVSETRRQNAHPAPIGAPALSPQSPSFALLRQHHGLARSRSWEKLRKQAWFPEPAGTVAARIFNSLEILSPWFPETWRYRFLCLCMWLGGMSAERGGGVAARGDPAQRPRGHTSN